MEPQEERPPEMHSHKRAQKLRLRYQAIFLILIWLMAISICTAQQPRDDRQNAKTYRLQIDLSADGNQALIASSNFAALPQLIARHYAEGYFQGYDPWERQELLTHAEFQLYMEDQQRAWPNDNNSGPRGCTCKEPQAGIEAVPIDASALPPEYDLSPIVDLIEVRWFDRTTGREKRQTRYIILYYTSDLGIDHPVVAFRFADVQAYTLSHCRWTGGVNEAQARTLEEVFRQQQYRAVIINDSGHEPRTYGEAVRIREQRIEALHNNYGN